MLKSNYSSIETIIKIAKKGGMFILVDDEKRENEGDLVISTSDTNSKYINFMAKFGRGLICLALDSLQAKRLNLSLMSPIKSDARVCPASPRGVQRCDPRGPSRVEPFPPLSIHTPRGRRSCEDCW